MQTPILLHNSFDFFGGRPELLLQLPTDQLLLDLLVEHLLPVHHRPGHDLRSGAGQLLSHHGQQLALHQLVHDVQRLFQAPEQSHVLGHRNAVGLGLHFHQ